MVIEYIAVDVTHSVIIVTSGLQFVEDIVVIVLEHDLILLLQQLYDIIILFNIHVYMYYIVHVLVHMYM